MTPYRLGLLHGVAAAVGFVGLLLALGVVEAR